VGALVAMMPGFDVPALATAPITHEHADEVCGVQRTTAVPAAGRPETTAQEEREAVVERGASSALSQSEDSLDLIPPDPPRAAVVTPALLCKPVVPAAEELGIDDEHESVQGTSSV